MKLLFLLLFFSLSWTKPSEDGITYRPLSWSDFRLQAPDNEPTVAARTTTQLAMETTETDGKFYFRIKAYFLPDSSFVRIRSDQNLRHEQTHFKIAYIVALECMQALIPLQGGDTTCQKMAAAFFEYYVSESSRRNDSFDQDTHHALDKAIEEKWEKDVTRQLHFYETSLIRPNGRNR